MSKHLFKKLVLRLNNFLIVSTKKSQVNVSLVGIRFILPSGTILYLQIVVSGVVTASNWQNESFHNWAFKESILLLMCDMMNS